MTVYLDDEPVAVDGPSLGAAIDAASRDLADAGRIVVEVQVDGESVLGEELDRRVDESVVEREVRLYSADPQALSREALEQVQSSLEESGRQQLEAADLLQRDEPAEAMPKVARAIELWQQTQQGVMQTTMLLGLEMDDLRAGDTSGSQLVQGLIDQLKGLRDLLLAKDLVGLADALEYEWPETVAKWQQLVADLLERVEGGASGA